MPQVHLTESVPVPIERAWVLVSDLSRYGEWLTLLDGWRSDLPAELASGTEISAVVKAKGIRNRVTFTVGEFDPPHHVSLVGQGVGGTGVTMTFSLTDAGASTDLSFDVDFRHPALRGPMSTIAARTIKGDLTASLARLRVLAA